MSDDIPWNRRIIICCDGTWQSSVSSNDNVPSNVTKLCRNIARIGVDRNDKTKKFHQLVYYDSGIGTGNLSNSERKRQGFAGAGLAENVIEAYNFIVLNYEPGDEIFCFGFSRGAYTARAVAGLVTDIGVIKPIDMQLFPQIYRAYQTNDEGKPFRETQAWMDFVYGKASKQGQNWDEDQRNKNKATRAQSWDINKHGDLAVSDDSRKVKVVGVWDTVGSLGVPDVAFFDLEDLRTKYGFHNVKLNGYIEHAFHALALDERRKAFRPTLWYIPKELSAELAEQNKKLPEDKQKKLPELKQVWFPGVHINCGGGSDDCITDMKGDLEHISTATFCWMLQCISPYITIDQKAFEASMSQYQRFLDRIRYSCTYHHDGWTDWAKKKLPIIPLINPAPDPLESPKRSAPHKHPEFDYGWGTGPIVDSYGGMYRLAGPFPRVPGHCQAEIWDEAEKEHKLRNIYDYGETNEYIHPICHYRDIVRGFEENAALKDFERSFKPTSGGKGRFWWLKKGDKKELPEWIILDDAVYEADGTREINYERAWYNQAEKPKEHVQKLAKDYKNGYLETLDEKNDFSVGEKQGWVYP